MLSDFIFIQLFCFCAIIVSIGLASTIVFPDPRSPLPLSDQSQENIQLRKQRFATAASTQTLPKSNTIRSNQPSFFSTRRLRPKEENSSSSTRKLINSESMEDTSKPIVAPTSTKLQAVKIVWSSKVAKLVLAACSVVYGMSFVSTKVLQDTLSPELLNFLRFLLASLWLLPEMFRGITDRKLIFAGLELGFWCALGFMTQAVGLKLSSASKAALFSSLAVVMPPFFALFDHSTGKESEKQKLSSRLKTFIPSFLALAGACVVEWGGAESPQWSDLLLFLTPFSFAMCFHRSEKYAAELPESTGAITASMLIAVTLYFAAWSFLQGSLPTSNVAWLELWQNVKSSNLLLGLLLFNGLLATGWTALSEQKALRVITASDATLIYTLEPIFAAIFSYYFLHEHIGVNTFIGATLIIIACLIG